MAIIAKIAKLLPDPLRPLARKIYYSPVDPLNDSIIPPKRFAALYGGGDFIAMGRHRVDTFISMAGLRPDHKVLDVGCGVGRMAIPLTQYLDANGRYDGFDIIPQGIKWCKKKIEPKFPNFHFELADVYNKYYNPHGKFQPSDYKFPYADNTFDFVCLTSVFTHMVTKDLERYLDEISRVLKQGSGKCFITFFLLNPITRSITKEGKSSKDFKFKIDGECHTTDAHHPESETAYDELFVRRLYERFNLRIMEPIRYGSWRFGKEGFDFQDIILASKAEFNEHQSISQGHREPLA